MKTAICADLHLNNSNFGRMDKNGLSFRTKDFMAAFEYFVNQCLSSIKPDRVIILGDVYENPHPPNPVRQFFLEMVRKLSNAGIKVDILVGNHDACYFSHALQPVVGAGFPNVAVHYAVEFQSFDEVAFLYLPHTEQVERRETTHKFLVKEAVATYAQAIANAKTAGIPVVALGHFGVCGAEMNDGVLNRNKDDASLSDLEALGVDAILLGHYHSQNWLPLFNADPEYHGGYVGSLERSTFNDRTGDKGFVLMDTVRGKKPAIEFVKYPMARQMIQVEGTADEIEEAIGKLKDAMPAGGAEPIVKVKFAGTMPEYAEFCKSKKGIRDILAGAKHIAFEKDIDDPDKDAKAESVRQQISKKSDVGSSDILEIFGAYSSACVADESERKAINEMAADIVSAIDDRCRTSKGVMPGRTRIHGVKLHNFQMYGTEKNVVEFDKGSMGFFGGIGMGRKDDWSVIRGDASVFLSSIPEDSRKLISVIGKIDGDEGDSNGAGKSSILDAISWAFYEKIVRDFFDKDSSKGSSIASVVRTIDDKPERECYVEVLFSAGKSLYLIRRERRFTSATKHEGGVHLFCLYSPDGQDDSGSMAGRRGNDAEEFINQLVSMDYDTFSNSVMFGQSDADKFIRGTDKVKKEIFVKILGLTILDEYLKETRARKLLLDKELASLEAQSAALTANSMSQEEMDAAEKKAALIDDNISSLKASISALEAKVKELRSDPVFAEEESLSREVEVLKAAIKRRMEEATNAAKSVSDAAAKEEKNLKALKDKLSNATESLGKAKDRDLILKADIATFNEAACKKDVKYGEEAKKAKPSRDAEKSELLAKKEAIVVAVSKMDGAISSAEARITKLKKSLKTIGDKQDVPCPECENMVSKSHVEEKIKTADAEVAAMRKDREEAARPLAGIQASIAEVDKRLANIEEYSQKGETASRKLVAHESNKAASVVAKKAVDDAAQRQADAANEVSKSEKTLDELKASAKKFSDEASADTAASSAKLAEANAKISGDVASRKAVVEAKIRTAERESKDAFDKVGVDVAEAATIRSKVEVSRKTIAKVAAMATEVAAKTSDQARLAVVEGGFGLDGIRVQIIEKYIPLLNVYIDEFLDVISGKMTMSVITDGKKDGKMELKIKGSSASDPRQLSKGQFARVKIATDLALGMMSLARNENAPDFVCLDEVFAPVDVNGKKSMFDVISKLQEYFRMVIVISHDPMVQETIKDTIVVNMVNDFSTIERQAHEH